MFPTSTFLVKKSDKGNQGLFTTTHFDANQVILTFKSNTILNTEAAKKLTPTQLNSLLQIGKDVYLDLSKDTSYFINHSCNPNSLVKIVSKSAFLISTRAIKPNEELTFDYSLTSTDTPDEWQMKCKCGEWNCRKIISGFNYLSDKDKDKFIKQGIVPKYIK